MQIKDLQELKVDALDLRLMGYMTAGSDIKDMLELCVTKIKSGELQNDRDQLIKFLKR